MCITLANYVAIRMSTIVSALIKEGRLNFEKSMAAKNIKSKFFIIPH